MSPFVMRGWEGKTKESPEPKAVGVELDARIVNQPRANSRDQGIGSLDYLSGGGSSRWWTRIGPRSSGVWRKSKGGVMPNQPDRPLPLDMTEDGVNRVINWVGRNYPEGGDQLRLLIEILDGLPRSTARSGTSSSTWSHDHVHDFHTVVAARNRPPNDGRRIRAVR